MSVTIRDVAKLAQVSPATVSRYFTGSTVVGDTLSKRIEAAANQLGYMPDRTVAKRDHGVIIVLLPHLQLGYFSEVLKEIIAQMSKYKCKIMILPTAPGDDSYKSFFKDLWQHRRTRKRKGPAGRFHPAGHIYAIPSALQPH